MINGSISDSCYIDKVSNFYMILSNIFRVDYERMIDNKLKYRKRRLNGESFVKYSDLQNMMSNNIIVKETVSQRVDKQRG